MSHADCDRHEVAGAGVEPVREAFYRDVMRRLQDADVPFLVGGAYAFAVVTNIGTRTKDLDLFMRRGDLRRALHMLDTSGYQTEVPYPHWLAKVRGGNDVIDIIFNSGNGIALVDDDWFTHAVPAEVLGVAVPLCPIEEMLWNKAFIMERERYDGADVAHLLRGCAERIDWPRLLRRFGEDMPVLLSHLILFGYIYPGERHRVPAAIIDELWTRTQADAAPGGDRLCRGSLLSRAQYAVDVDDWGYVDARRGPHSTMSDEEVAQWTAAAPERPHALDAADAASNDADRTRPPRLAGV